MRVFLTHLESGFPSALSWFDAKHISVSKCLQSLEEMRMQKTHHVSSDITKKVMDMILF